MTNDPAPPLRSLWENHIDELSLVSNRPPAMAVVLYQALRGGRMSVLDEPSTIPGFTHPPVITLRHTRRIVPPAPPPINRVERWGHVAIGVAVVLLAALIAWDAVQLARIVAP